MQDIALYAYIGILIVAIGVSFLNKTKAKDDNGEDYYDYF
jgi:hypothetical protein